MPRANDGTVTLVVGNPVVTGTAISADVHNATMTDLASMIEDSLSRTGKGGMASPIKFANGTEDSPSITFTSDTDTGIYRIGENSIGVSAAGTQVLGISDAGATLDGDLVLNGDLTLNGVLTIDGWAAQESTSTSGFTHTGDVAWTEVTNATISITTKGRPVMLTLTGSSDVNEAFVGVTSATNPTAAYFKWERTGTSSADVGLCSLSTSGNGTIPSLGVPPGVLNCVDVVSAGTYNYRLLVKCLATTDTASVWYCKVVAYEL